MSCKRLLGAIAVGVFALSAAAAYAGVPADATCKDKKAKESGKYVLNVAKAFGANIKVTNTSKLSGDLSKARSKITKGFSKAEDPGGCATNGDADDIEAKVDAFVQDVTDELLFGSPSGAFVDGTSGSLD